jgi:3-oxoacyl-[acyl-carrier protein] reductase
LSTIEGPGKLATAAGIFGTIDFLINNARRSITCDLVGTPDDKPYKVWADTVSLNCWGAFLLTGAVLPMLSGVGSRIVNIGSSTSRDPDADMPIYEGTKGMIESFTRCWARDFARKYGCTVNTVAPGPAATEILLAESLLQQL